MSAHTCLSYPDSVVCWGDIVQAGRSRFRDPIRPLNVSISPNPSSRTMTLEFTQPLKETSIRKCFWGVNRCRRVRLTTSPPSVARLSRKCEIIDVLQSYRPARHVTGIALLFLFTQQEPLTHQKHVFFCYSRSRSWRLSLNARSATATCSVRQQCNGSSSVLPNPTREH
jgi:hypothetical protein